MTAALCSQCGGHGFDRQNRVCTSCAGSGRDPYNKAPGSADPPPLGRGRHRAPPIRKPLQIAIIIAGLVVGFAVYHANGATDDATGLGVLAFVGTLIAGTLLVRVLGNLVQVAFLVVLFLAADHLAFDGRLTPLAGAALSDIWIHLRSALMP